MIGSNRDLQAADAEQAIGNVMIANKWHAKARKSTKWSAQGSRSSLGDKPQEEQLHMRWNVCEHA